MSARRSRPSPSSPVTTRSLCSSCCRKCASSPLTSPRILSSVKVRCRAKACPVSPRCWRCHGLWGCHSVLKECASHLYQGTFPPLQWVVGAPCHPSNLFPASVVPQKPLQIQPSCCLVKTWAIIARTLASVRTRPAMLPASPRTAWCLGSPARRRCLLCSTEGALVRLEGLLRATAC